MLPRKKYISNVDVLHVILLSINFLPYRPQSVSATWTTY